MSNKLFLTQKEDTELRNFIDRANQSPYLELEARWWNNKNRLSQDDFMKLFNVLKNNKNFKVKKEFTRKVIYNNNYFKLYKKDDGKQIEEVPGFFRKIRRKNDVINTQYGFRIMLSTEATVSKEEFDQNNNGNPFFRNRDRTSFVIGFYSFDLTISTEGASIKEVGDAKASKTYEVEIEYLGNQQNKKIPSQEILNTFIQNLAYVVSIIQDSPAIIGDIERNEVINEYNESFLNKGGKKRKFLSSPLTKPIDIEHKTLSLLQEGYSVTEKADGLRMVTFVSAMNGLGYIYFIQHIGNTIKIRKSQMTSKDLMGTVLDGEFIKMGNGSFIYLIIDILWYKKDDVRKHKLLDRLAIIQNKVMPYLDKRVFSQKAFHFKGNIHELAKKVLDTKFQYEIDGLIFTPLNESYDKKTRNIFKWKPHKLLTLDFLVIKDIDDPTNWKLFMNSKNGVPKLFSHPKFINAGSLKVSKDTNGKFNDVSIIEFEWDGNKWKPVNSRPDKTVGNYESVVESVFSLILNPVTKAQIIGKEQFYEPVETTIEARNQAKTIGLRNFHNFIKTKLIIENTKPNQSLSDFGSGKGGDIMKWRKAKLSSVIGFDIVPENIVVAKDRLSKIKGGSDVVQFYQADLSKDSVQKILSKKIGIKKDFDVITSFFGIHYFFDDRKSVNVFFKNVSQSLKTGGIFIVTTFDAKEIYKLLKGKEVYKTDKFEITKYYDDDKAYGSLPMYGNKITVKILDTELRKPISEYLVKPDSLKNIAKRHGLKLEKTGLFSELYNGNKLSESEKQLSFLNRFYIFRRTEGNSLVEQENMI